jgi:hypothetical protein
MEGEVVMVNMIWRAAIITAILTFGLWWVNAAPVWADEGDFQACATLIGEGELCGWPQIDPDEYEQEHMIPEETSGEDAICLAAAGVPCSLLEEAEDGECPVEVGEGVICTGPDELEMPEATSPSEGEAGSDESSEANGAENNCDIPVGEDVIGCEAEIPASDQEITASLIFVPSLSR